MVIDTSALVCIVLEEPEAAAFARTIAEDSIRLVSVVSLIEAGIVLETPWDGPEVRSWSSRSGL